MVRSNRVSNPRECEITDLEEIEKLDFFQGGWQGKRLHSGGRSTRELSPEEVNAIQLGQARCTGACCTAFGNPFPKTIN
ncbi:MAG: hypothetical protein PHP25_04995 [Candidatus Moranbacteria bacterium]|nr:hypothetical protein [Candidatus Moranbacteria bacterium]